VHVSPWRAALALLSELLFEMADAPAQAANKFLKFAYDRVTLLAAGAARAVRGLGIDGSRSLDAGHEPDTRCPRRR